MTGSLPSSGRIAPALTSGLAGAVAVWIVWFFTHVPWAGPAGPVASGVIVLAWIITSSLVLRGLDPRRALTAGALGGFVTAAFCLLILGSKLTRGHSELVPNAAIISLGFVALGVGIGLVAGWIAGRGSAAATEPDWLARFAWATVAAAAPLLFIGGLVTSTQSGMAVPDWPSTYSANMFLYPLGNAAADVFLEHSHRLFGTLLGLASLILMILTFRTASTRSASPEGAPSGSFHSKLARIWSVAIFLAVCVQGALGGIRVLLGNPDPARDNRLWSFVHGVSAQVIFAALVSLAVYVSAVYRTAAADPSLPRARALRAVSAAAFHATFLQIVFGAMYRHFGGGHALWTHVGFSLLVVLTASLSGFYASALHDPANPAAANLVRHLRLAGKWQVGVVGLQFALGWAAFAVVHHDRTVVNTIDVIIRTAHQANGALLIAVTCVIAILARRLCPKKVHAPA